MKEIGGEIGTVITNEKEDTGRSRRIGKIPAGMERMETICRREARKNLAAVAKTMAVTETGIEKVHLAETVTATKVEVAARKAKTVQNVTNHPRVEATVMSQTATLEGVIPGTKRNLVGAGNGLVQMNGGRRRSVDRPKTVIVAMTMIPGRMQAVLKIQGRKIESGRPLVIGTKVTGTGPSLIAGIEANIVLEETRTERSEIVRVAIMIMTWTTTGNIAGEGRMTMTVVTETGVVIVIAIVMAVRRKASLSMIDGHSGIKTVDRNRRQISTAFGGLAARLHLTTVDRMH